MQKKTQIELLLWRIANQSDEKAFKEFFNLFADRLYQFAFSFLKSTHLSEEAVADVFLKVWISRTGLTNIENIKAYLFKAAYNTSLNYLDDAKRREAENLEYLDVGLGVDRICPETKLIQKELKDKIDKAVETLPPRCKLIYKLAKVEQMKYKEISDLLGISVKTIDNQLSIALKKIGDELKSYYDEGIINGHSLVLLQLFVPKLMSKSRDKKRNK